ncbi:MAG: MAPEG family protein [Hyphomicrobiales bacterium]|nr:MAPEG family protein [Hyphomicrobiales bacterium]
MPISITAIYASILALIILALSINVTMHRVKLKVSLGDGGNPQMLRMIRLHANAIEYIPIALVLMAIYEINGGWHWALHVVGIALVAGRLIQTAGMWTTDVAGNGRRIGQSLTWLSLAALALLNLAKVL